MKPGPFEYLRAGSVDEAVSALGRFEGDARLLAGGQSLVPMMNMRLVRSAGIVDINAIPGLAHIERDDGALRIGALTRYSQLEASPLVADAVPLLAETVRYVGDRQVRNRGTIGGSLAQADPTGEIPVAALALDATLQVRGAEGDRDVAADAFFLGPYMTELGDADMIVGVRMAAQPGSVSAFAEHVRRHGDFAVVSVAAVGIPGEGGVWRSVRLALGGAGDRPFLATEASALLTGTRLEDEAVRQAGEACAQMEDIVSDIRASAEYRRHLIPIYVRRVLGELRRRGEERLA